MPATNLLGEIVDYGEVTPAEASTTNLFRGKGAGSTLAAKGEGNIGFGFSTLAALTSGKFNVAIGLEASTLLKTGEANIAIGRSALPAQTSGVGNIAIGNEAGKEISTAGNNIFIGFTAGEKISTGEGNTIIGQLAVKGTAGAGTKENTAVGYKAGEKMNGAGNVAIGYEAGAGLETSNKLVIANNATTPIIEGVMSATAGSNELKLGTTGGKVGLYGTAPVVRPAEIKVPGAYKVGVAAFETEAEAKAIRDKLTTVIEALKGIGLCA